MIFNIFNSRKTIVLLVFSVLLVFACKHSISDTAIKDKKLFSTKGDNESKGMSGNCMSCHEHSSKNGEKYITLGGSLFKNDKKTLYSNGGVVRLYTEPNGGGQLIKTIEVDEVGNFYSDAPYIFNTPYYVEIESVTGKKVYMNQALASGSCNSCHGITEQVIHVD